MVIHKIKRMYSNSIHSQIINIMTKTKKSMTVDEITEKLMKNNMFRGKTPENTVSSVLQRSHYVKRISKGIYQLDP
jgi:hypothetical protein